MIKIPKYTDNSKRCCCFSHFISQVKANQFVDSFEKFRGKSIFLPLTTERTIFGQASLFYILDSTNYKRFSQNTC